MKMNRRKPIVKSLATKMIKAHGLEAPVDINKLAINLGFTIELDDDPDERDSAVTSLKLMIIMLNPQHHIHRQRFSLGHELGHYILKHDIERNSPTEEEETYKDMSRRIEHEADLFSACVLMPEEHFKQTYSKGVSPDELTRIYKVSKAAVWIRLQDLKLI